MISFKTSKFETNLIRQIVTRAVKMAADAGVSYSTMDAHMDISACHANGCPLDLNKLLEALDGDFGHDVFGIRRHINRTTGKLEDCFLPRCAMPEKLTAA